MSTNHKSSGSKKGLSAFEKKFAAERKKQGAGGIFDFKGKNIPLITKMKRYLKKIKMQELQAAEFLKLEWKVLNL